MLEIAVIPIDNRPICYDIIKDTLAINSDIKLHLPKISDLGGLTAKANIQNIFKFLEGLKNIDYLIVSLDTIAYGGLVTSRRTDDSFDEIKNRIDKFKFLASKKAKKILAFSSVMRISNNNINEEEKEYWAKYGKKIFDWSYNYHRNELEKTSNTFDSSIPKEILDDYLNTRKRNLEINKYYLELAKDGFFDYLIFSKDDCAKYGLNVKEANLLADKASDLKNIKIKTGADEIPLSLLSRALVDYYGKDKKISIKPTFLEKNSTHLISKYEDISIKNCVEAQIELANCKVDFEKYDLNMLINNFAFEQGDLVLSGIVNSLSSNIEISDEPYFISDVNNANGADCALINKLFETKADNNFFGYCGYNTSANTIGAALFIALSKYFAVKNNSYNENAFKKIEFIRFLDDWGYQAISRKFIRESAPDFTPALEQKKQELNNNAKKISEFLSYYPSKIEYSLPWQRSFEIRIELLN